MDIEYIREWFVFADRNLAIAQHLKLTFQPVPLEDICYNCQQAVEKYLKGSLLCFLPETLPPRTHDLVDLCKQCAKHDASFMQLITICAAVSPFGVMPRYPQEIYIDEPLMQKVLTYAVQVQDFAPIAQLRQALENNDESN
ncbi:MAG: HEPN domain-containing protein [Oscillospiraceae bacterium]|nr:HEPN domain-containing protein [Oscillospiraceae bacterium]